MNTIRKWITRYRQARCNHVRRTYITRPDGGAYLCVYCPDCRATWDGGRWSPGK